MEINQIQEIINSSVLKEAIAGIGFSVDRPERARTSYIRLKEGFLRIDWNREPKIGELRVINELVPANLQTVKPTQMPTIPGYPTRPATQSLEDKLKNMSEEELSETLINLMTLILNDHPEYVSQLRL